MQFRLVENSDGTKEIHYRSEDGTPFKFIAIGKVDVPDGAQARFRWITEKLKDAGAVPQATQFNLNEPGK